MIEASPIVADTLCGSCGHRTGDHWTTDEATPELLQAAGVSTPCTKCSISPDRKLRRELNMFCIGFVEWPINDIPYPGTQQARWIGCSCPTGINVARARHHREPLYAPDCIIHMWICKRRTTCAHEDDGEVERSHDRLHQPCEHCTVPNVECAVCAAVWTDWRMQAEKVGWEPRITTRVSLHKPRKFGPNFTVESQPTWLCPTCSTQTGKEQG